MKWNVTNVPHDIYIHTQDWIVIINVPGAPFLAFHRNALRVSRSSTNKPCLVMHHDFASYASFTRDSWKSIVQRSKRKKNKQKRSRDIGFEPKRDICQKVR